MEAANRMGANEFRNYNPISRDYQPRIAERFLNMAGTVSSFSRIPR